MALITCNFFSETLGLNTSITVILPQQTRSQIGLTNVSQGKKHPTLYLLHGLSDDDTIWARRTSIERYVAEYGIAVVMPNVHRSFYTDMKYGGAYWTYLTEELPAVARSFFPLSEEREQNFVAGLSMGGYGAFKWALRYPEQFAAAGSFSGALDMAARSKMKDDPVNAGNLYQMVFGDEPLDGTDNDLLHLVKRGERTGEGIGAEAVVEVLKPALYQSCGTEDFLYENNQAFRQAAEGTGYVLTYEEGPGGHSWVYWDEQIQRFLKWLPLK